METGNSNRPSRSFTREHSLPPRNGNDGREIAATISRLMSHYWTADDPIESRREQIIDWIEDLIEFGAAAVADACREWRQTQSRRPTPADIRKLCIAEQIRQREAEIRFLPPPAKPEPEAVQINAEDRAYCIALADKAIAALKWDTTESIPTGYSVVEQRKSREYTSEELRASRIVLGLEPADAAE